MGTPTDEDARWLTEALQDDERKWFVADLAHRCESLAELFFIPMLEAAIEEVNPSSNRRFVEPCMHFFGPSRVNEYLLSVVETGTDFRKAGAVSALYWARGFSYEYPGSKPFAAMEMSEDDRKQRRTVLLETFVANPNLDVRRCIIPHLNLDPTHYPESHRPLVAKAIEIARASADDYIRQRAALQIERQGSRKYPPLPHRDKGAGGS